MADKITSMLGVNTDQVDTDPQFSVGTMARGEEAVYQYVKAAAAISTADSTASQFCVAIDENSNAQLVTTALADAWRRLGVAPPFTIAINKYFWARVSGVGLMRVVASASADVSLRTTTTAGRLGTASTVSSTVFPGMVLVTAASASGASAGSTVRNAIIVTNSPARKSAVGGIGSV